MTDPVVMVPEFACQPIFFNQSRFREDLAKKPNIKVFKDAISGVNTHFEHRFEEGEDVRFLVAERATFIDLILHYAWFQHQWDDDISLIAVGGYGRAELHPHSDIDILILLENKAGKKYQEALQQFITFLWDIGLEIGSSVRTLKECVKLAKSDITVATNVMESRRIAGSDQLRDQLQTLTGSEHMWPILKFFDAKVTEQQERHTKHQHTQYNLEPNLKNAPGGLRDLQTINWIAKRFYRVQTLLQLQGQDFFTEQEFGSLRKAEAFIWRVRYALHQLTNRSEDRLQFDFQRELAKQFGYEDNDSELAVEQFMHEYYRTATAIRELNDVLLGVLEEEIYAQQNKRFKVSKLSDDFQLVDQYLEVTHDRVFEQKPAVLIEIFVLLGENPEIKGVRPSTIRLIRESKNLIDDAFRTDPYINALFIRLLKVEKGMLTQLKRMSRYGILGRYLPEFGRITGQMQHDLFHRYTVDAHTLLVIKNIRDFLLPSAKEEFPIAADVIQTLPQKELLYIAALYHDIGKGRGGDHSELGAVDAEAFCVQHGLNGRETRLVVWLVKYHLLMSFVSQKKDISDPEVIHDFALTMGDQLHLDHLFLLTIADMRGTNPDIWNSWRATLIRQLYEETKRALRRGLENTIDYMDIVIETQQNALSILQDSQIDKEQVTALWDGMGDDYFLREGSTDIAWHTQAIAQHKGDNPLILVRESDTHPWRGATQIFIHTQDVDNVFLAAASALAQLDLNIQDARLYSSKSGFTIDTFYVLDQDYKPIKIDKTFTDKITRTLLQELELVDQYSDVVKRRTPRQLKQFATPTRTIIHNDPTSMLTVVEVITPDRPGLLATIGSVFMEFDINLQNAKISTLGERVEDVFFITDKNHQPLSDPALCEALQTTLCKQLDLRVEKDL